jgi:serine protease
MASAERLRCESLAFRVDPAPAKTADAAARAVARAALPRRWSLIRLGGDGEFEAVPPSPVSPADAWTLTYALRDRPGVLYAEPLFELKSEAQFPRAEPLTRSARGDHDPGTAEDCEWSQKRLRVPEAWSLFGPRRPGAGIRVGHPDTGYTEHPELPARALIPESGFDFQDDDADPSDPLSTRPLQHPGHGTSTASLIVSPRGRPPGLDGAAFVSGVAPGARLIPIRVTASVVLWSTRRLTRAIRHAVEHGAHVVSISLGGPAPSIALHNAVRDAEQAGVIVLCAAGNEVRFVVFPAAYDEVIAVAASRVDDRVWPASCRGPAVDITAPGSSVWRAKTSKQGRTPLFTVERGSGTSYAVAQVAGIAALWLSLHGRSSLVARYGRARLGRVFRSILQSTCRTPAEWDTDAFGPGIADARAALGAPLPAIAPTRTVRRFARRAVSDDRPLDWLAHQLAPAPRSAVIGTLADLLRVPERRLDVALDDIGAELATRAGVDRVFREQLQAAAAARSERRPTRGAHTAMMQARRRAADRNASIRLRGWLTAAPGVQRAD